MVSQDRSLPSIVAAAVTAFLLVLVALPRTVSTAEGDWRLTIEPLPSPAGENSAGPRFTVSGDHVIMSWTEVAGLRTTVKFVERTRAGWSDPRTVVSDTTVMVNSADVPSVLALADGTLAAQWLQKNGPNPEVYNLRLQWSKNGGRTWSKAFSPHHDGTKTQHGFAALFQTPGAGLGLVWLDGRATNPDVDEGPEAGNMSLRATVFGRDGKQGPDTAIDTRVCDCCSTDVAVSADGPIVAYRDRSDQEIRDISVARLVGGHWTTPASVHADGWRIKGCPVNGPAVAARDRAVAVAWFTAPKADEGHVFVAFSQDAGQTFDAPLRVDDAEAAGRVGVTMLADGAVVVSWVESSRAGAQFRLRRIERSGNRSVTIGIADVPSGRHPRVAYAGDELLLAWTETPSGVPHVRTARAALPR
jgi:hypothetical protein